MPKAASRARPGLRGGVADPVVLARAGVHGHAAQRADLGLARLVPGPQHLVGAPRGLVVGEPRHHLDRLPPAVVGRGVGAADRADGTDGLQGGLLAGADADRVLRPGRRDGPAAAVGARGQGREVLGRQQVGLEGRTPCARTARRRDGHALPTVRGVRLGRGRRLGGVGRRCGGRRRARWGAPGVAVVRALVVHGCGGQRLARVGGAATAGDEGERHQGQQGKAGHVSHRRRSGPRTVGRHAAGGYSPVGRVGPPAAPPGEAPGETRGRRGE